MHRAQMLKIELPDDTCQPIITLKVVTERESNVGASTEAPTHHAIHAMAGEGPEKQPANSPRLQNRSFLQAAGTKCYEDHAGDQATAPLFFRVLFECFAYEVCFGL